MLDTVEVKAQAIKKTDEVFIKTGAISTRDKILESNQSLETIVRSMPGAFTQMDKSQGVVSVNIRGGSGFGRANNAIGPNYMGMLAGKYQFNDSTWIGALFGHSWRKISQNYKIGGGRKVTDSSIDLSKIYDLDKESSTTSPFNAAHLKQKPMSRMAKLEYGDKYQTITLLPKSGSG
ncbi:hypothetical protein [Mannheimia haemolytica]|uniref:hypothetical protein n=1 Tax=Mannheimia haemolytica TaxID=75985 RepID=UPI0001BCFD66|nr:hypothetical protein [Mannheimia haemolytica]EEY13751.1 TonB-dependent receptor [Mannheimia haemolytica serotype A2 str. BOVINE]